ncbi:MAG: hypothetical protein WBL95_08050 [Microcoleus sp.]
MFGKKSTILCKGSVKFDTNTQWLLGHRALCAGSRGAVLTATPAKAFSLSAAPQFGSTNGIGTGAGDGVRKFSNSPPQAGSKDDRLNFLRGDRLYRKKNPPRFLKIKVNYQKEPEMRSRL